MTENYYMKSIFKTIGYLSLIPVLIGLYFFNNIKGYYRFEELCAAEKIKQVVGKVEPDMGWVYNEGVPTTPSSTFVLASSHHVKFVRFMDYDNKHLYDVTYFGSNRPAKNQYSDNKAYQEFYDIKPADLTKQPVYLWKKIEEQLPGELRTSRYGDQIIDLRVNKIIVNLTNIGFGLFDRNHTLLDAPSGNTCDWYEYLGKDSNKKLIFGELDLSRLARHLFAYDGVL